MAPDQSSSDGNADTDSREMGIDFGELDGELQTLDYPVTREALLDEYGDAEIETSGGSETLQSILGGQEMETGGSESHEYESADAVHQSILNMVGSEAVGREDYSDRGGSVESAGERETAKANTARTSHCNRATERCEGTDRSPNRADRSAVSSIVAGRQFEKTSYRE